MKILILVSIVWLIVTGLLMLNDWFFSGIWGNNEQNPKRFTLIKRLLK